MAAPLMHCYALHNGTAHGQRTPGRTVYAEYIRQLKYAPGLLVKLPLQ